MEIDYTTRERKSAPSMACPKNFLTPNPVTRIRIPIPTFGLPDFLYCLRPTMSKYSHDTVVPFKDSDRTKKEQVASMFDQIAFRYDFLNRFLSGGIDLYWRRRAIRELKEIRPQQVLDVATGTGDLAIMTWKYIQPQKITGIDISEGMLNLGRQKVAKLLLNKHIELLNGDSEAINFKTNTFDAVTVAFGVRNLENLERGLEEMHRVLIPIGKLV